MRGGRGCVDISLESVESVSTIAATIIAVIALLVSVGQITVSNRQSLYSHRIDWIMHVADLVSLYETNRSQVLELDRSEPHLAADLMLVFLTNDVWLEKIGAEMSGASGERGKQEVLATLEDMKKTAMESEMLFREKVSKPGARFIYAYEALLEEMRRYALIVQRMTEYNERRIGGPTSLEEASSEIGEPRYRNDLHAAIEAVESAYQDISKSGTLDEAKRAARIFRLR